jgi:hypothetical protein
MRGASSVGETQSSSSAGRADDDLSVTASVVEPDESGSTARKLPCTQYCVELELEADGVTAVEVIEQVP